MKSDWEEDQFCLYKRTLKRNERNKMNAVLLRSAGYRVTVGRPVF